MTRTAFPPGEYIAEELGERRIARELAMRRLCLDENEFDALLAGQLRIGVSLAERIGSLFGTSAVLWLHLEKAYRRALSAPPPHSWEKK